MADIMSSIDVEKSLKGMDGWSHNDVFNSISKLLTTFKATSF